MPPAHDTIAALATPVGTAALAVVRISGPDTMAIVGALAPSPPRPRVATHLDYHDRHGALLDDIVLTVYAGPRSYTGEDAAELSAHGNPFIAQQILEDLFARGCRPAEPGEFTQRAFLHGRMDLSQAEAVMDVIHARGERALTAAHAQLRGALGRRMRALIEGLLGLLARIEAYIDFPDEDLPPEDRASAVLAVEQLQRETGVLLATSHYGDLLRDGIRTVIVGEPNVGKSSLLNRLIGRERALVSPEPGTTRDFIEERIIVGPHCLRLIDTAGLNPSPGNVEKLGIAKTHELFAEADLVLVVLDGSVDRPAIPAEIEQELNQRIHLIVLNKSDLGRNSSPLAGVFALNVSALTGAGIDDLVRSISAAADTLVPAADSEKVAVNARHATSLQVALDSLASARDNLLVSGPVELLASDLRGALDAYGQITGKIDNERMLDHLFSSFCIGK